MKLALASYFLFHFFFFSFEKTYSQYIGNALEEEIFYAETKQVNQFFKRFNNEENLKGKKYDKKNTKYRSKPQRKKYLSILFDEENSYMSSSLKREFVQHVINTPVFLNFHGGEWDAEIRAQFLYKKDPVPLTIYLSLQEEKLGSKWVIKDIYFQSYTDMFDMDTAKYTQFLHPLSHELDFINLKKVFANKQIIEQYRDRFHDIDFLTLFMYELKKGLFKFQTITNIKFHFFQIAGWYFELSYFNREKANRGWLISNLLKISKKERSLLKNVIYGKK